jgi:hypothetical protein
MLFPRRPFLKYLEKDVFVLKSDFTIVFTSFRAFSEYIICPEMSRNGELENGPIRR